MFPFPQLERHLSEQIHKNERLRSGGHHWMVGSWLYGDYKHAHLHDDHRTAHGCADAW